MKFNALGWLSAGLIALGLTAQTPAKANPEINYVGLTFMGGASWVNEDEHVWHLNEYKILPKMSVQYDISEYFYTKACLSENEFKELGWDVIGGAIYSTDTFSPLVEAEISHQRNQPFFSFKGTTFEFNGGIQYQIPEHILSESSLSFSVNHFIHTDRSLNLDWSKLWNERILSVVGIEYQPVDSKFSLNTEVGVSI